MDKIKILTIKESVKNNVTKSTRVSQKRLDALVEDALTIEALEAKNAEAIGYMAREFIQATMPYRDPGDIAAWKRTNGTYTLIIQSGLDKNLKPIGLPYGNIPRLLLIWIATEVTLKKERILVLGSSLNNFLNKLNLGRSSGGHTGNATRFKEQMKRLFSAKISCINDSKQAWEVENIILADKASIWWNNDELSSYKTNLILSERFYNDLLRCPVPINLNAIHAIQNSPLSIDIYCWMTYRFSYLKSPALIPWELLRLQFGSNYKDTKQGKYKFKENFIKRLRAVGVIYDVQTIPMSKGLLLRPSKSHIKKLS